MKKLVIVLVIVVAAVGGYFLFSSDKNGLSGDSNNTGNIEVQKTDPTLIERLANARVTASEDGNKVKLVNGEATFPVAGGGKGKVSIGDVATEKIYNGRNDILAIINVDPGTGEEFQYLVLFEDKDGAVEEKSIAFLGSAIVKSVVATDIGSKGAEEYVVSLSAVVRDPGEPAGAKPSLLKNYIFMVEKGTFNFAKSIEI